MFSSTANLRPRRRRQFVILLRYVRVILNEFRWSLLILAAAVILGTALHAVTTINGSRPGVGISIYSAWMALFAQPQYNLPLPWYLLVLYAAYPVLGFILIGEGVVRLAMLVTSRRRGEKEWMLVVASTYRDHVVLCGLGHLGFRVLEQLVQNGSPVVVLERSASNPFLTQAKAMDVPVLIRDMKEDQALIDARIQDASAIVICSNEDMANLEVAIDSRRLNPKIRIIMRLFDQQIASKIAGALTVDAAFSSSALAAPVVAALSLSAQVLSCMSVNGESYVAAEIVAEPASALAGTTISQIETEHPLRVLTRTPRGGQTHNAPAGTTAVEPGDRLVVHVAAKQLAAIASAARAGGGK